MPKNTARPDESEWRNIESGEVSDIKDNDSPIEASEIVENFRCFQLDKIFNFGSFKLERQPFMIQKTCLESGKLKNTILLALIEFFYEEDRRWLRYRL